MPRFYYHLRTGSGVIPDREGSEHEDAGAARSEAISAAKEATAQALLAGTSLKVALDRCYEVSDEAGSLLFTVPFGDAANEDDYKP